MPKIGPRYRVKFRRRREGKTDYGLRLSLLRSGKPRLAARISLNHVVAQVVGATPDGDITLASAHSKQLEKFGWRYGTSNLPAAYLVGLLCGYRALKANVKECVLDIGIHDPTPGSKVFAVLKGALDAGLQIPHDEGILPPEERISGKHISQYAAALKGRDPSAYQARFSGYLARGLPPEQIPEQFNEVKRAIITQFG
jgi:large subunit ribosomal protein L18